MKLARWSILLVALTGCHPGRTRGTEPELPDEVVGSWKNECACVKFWPQSPDSTSGFCHGDLCNDEWTRLAPRMIVMRTDEVSTTVQAEVSDDDTTLDLYWEAEDTVLHATLVRLDDEACPQ